MGSIIRRNVPTKINPKSFSTSSSTPKNILAADTGPFATHIYHKLTPVLAFATPIYLFAPTENIPMVEKSFSLLLSGTIAMHSWIGLNYIAVDYVPKVSKALLGPSRVVIAGLSLVTFLGLSKVSVDSEGGIKGLMRGLWGKTEKKETKSTE